MNAEQPLPTEMYPKTSQPFIVFEDVHYLRVCVRVCPHACSYLLSHKRASDSLKLELWDAVLGTCMLGTQSQEQLHAPDCWDTFQASLLSLYWAHWTIQNNPLFKVACKCNVNHTPCPLFAVLCSTDLEINILEKQNSVNHSYFRPRDIVQYQNPDQHL